MTTLGETESYPLPVFTHSHTLRAHQGPVYVVKFAVGGQYCLSAGQDRTVRLWNPSRQHPTAVSDDDNYAAAAAAVNAPEVAYKSSEIATFQGAHSYQILDLALAHDNAKFASCGADRHLFLWDVASARVIRRFAGHTGRVNAVAFAGCPTAAGSSRHHVAVGDSDESVLISASYDTTVRFWDLRSHARDALMVIGQGHFKDSVTSVDTNQHQVLAGSVDGTVRAFDVRTGKCIIDTANAPVAWVRVSHDAQFILASSLNSTVKLIDRATGTLLNEYRGHLNDSYLLKGCMDDADQFVFLGGEDGAVHCWNLMHPQQHAQFLATQPRAAGPCMCVDMSSADIGSQRHLQLLSASADGSIGVWYAHDIPVEL